jgi:hypothetical protein
MKYLNRIQSRSVILKQFNLMTEIIKQNQLKNMIPNKKNQNQNNRNQIQ